ncbi:MAG: phosphotransferase family protein [Thermoanaerobaculia bacterium]|nr:phosphotransferase family protein [Thermoanaerobaculia bacterium]
MSNPWIDRSSPIREGEELNEDRLARFLREPLGLEGALDIRQFPRGFSNLTYLVRVGDRELVLRRPPFGSDVETAHDMGREYRILSRLRPRFPKVPEPLVYCEDEKVLGAPFYLMERVEGAILRAPVAEDREPPRERVSALAGSFVDTFVELHRVEVESTGLIELGKPEGYVRRQIEGWAGRYRRARTDEIPAMEEVARWLEERMPAERGVSLIHNDYKYDNLVLDPGDWSRIRAVLDWEMATVGDPWMDLGCALGYWVEPGDPEPLQGLNLSPTTLPGNPSRRELVERYVERVGENPGPIVFYVVYGLFRLAVIIQQIYARYVQGHTEDPRFARLIDGVKACAWAADRAIELDRIDDLG